MSATMVKKCDCESEFQDKFYGHKLRVHNYAVKKEVWRCTVCGKERK